MGVYVKGRQMPTKRVPSGQSHNNLHNQIRQLLEYSTKYKIYVCESILI